MKIEELINQVLIENNKNWLTEDQAKHSISENRLVITRKDIHDIINKLPIRVYGDNITIRIDEQGILATNTNPNTNRIYGFQTQEENK